MLLLKDVSLQFNDGGHAVNVLKQINLEFLPGRFYAITGPNASGKSSVAKIITGIYIPTYGEVIYKGNDITKKTVSERAKMGISYAFQHPPRFKGLTVRDLLKYSLGKDDENEMQCALSKVGLCPEEYLDRMVDSRLSGGEAKRIELATVIARHADVMIYDEPEAGVDLWSMDQIRTMLYDFFRSSYNITIVITHSETFLQMANEIIIIADGEVKTMGSYQDIKQFAFLKEKRCFHRKTCGGVADVTGYCR